MLTYEGLSYDEKKWMQQNLYEFCGKLQFYPLLWDPEYVGYNSKVRRRKTMTELMWSLGMVWLTADILEERMNLVFVLYRRELVKALRDPKYTPTEMPWFLTIDNYMREIMLASPEIKSIFTKEELAEALTKGIFVDMERRAKIIERRRHLRLLNFRRRCYDKIKRLLEDQEDHCIGACRKNGRTARRASRFGPISVPENIQYPQRRESRMLSGGDNVNITNTYPSYFGRWPL